MSSFGHMDSCGGLCQCKIMKDAPRLNRRELYAQWKYDKQDSVADGCGGFVSFSRA